MIKETITTWSIIKTNAAQFAGVIMGLIAPVQYILLLVFAFIAADTVAGVWAAHKTGKNITSRKFSTFIGKMIVYATLILLAYGLDVLLLGEFLWYIVKIKLLTVKITAIALCFAEVFSIDEKMKMVRPGEGLFFHFKRLLGVAKIIKKEAHDLTEDEKSE